MAANGYKYTMECGNKTYFFDTLAYIYEERIEDTPMLDGTIYRVRAASGKNSIKLGCRFLYSQISRYRELFTTFGTGTRDFTLNSEQFTGWALVSGKISTEENEQFAKCELILAEVSV